MKSRSSPPANSGQGTSARRRFVGIFTGSLGLLLCSLAGAHCAGAGPGDTPGTDASPFDTFGLDALSEASETLALDGTSDVDGAGDSGSGEVADADLDASDILMDVPSDTDSGPVLPTTCSAAPKIQPAIKINHSPDGLRRVATAAMSLLADGKILVVMLEAIDTTGRHGVFARTIDPALGTASADVRLDNDADGVTGSSSISLTSVSNGAAVLLRYQPTAAAKADAHIRVFVGTKWSPEPPRSVTGDSGVAGFDPTIADPIGAIVAPGAAQVLVTRGGDSPQALAYKPADGVDGSWSSVQDLALTGATGAARVDGYALADGRFVTLIWHGAGGPAARLRSPSGAWTTATSRADLGALSNTPTHRMLDDGTIVLLAVEPAGVDTRKVVAATWSASGGWTASRLLSKIGESNGVIPVRADPLLFAAGPSAVDFVGWVSSLCSTAASACEFKPYQRRYEAGVWKDAKALDMPTVTGTTGTSVVALEDGRPAVIRRPTDRKQVIVAIRPGDTEFTAGIDMFVDPPYDGTITGDLLLSRTANTVWMLGSQSKADGTSPPSVMGRLEIKVPPIPVWTTLVDDTASLRGLGIVNRYADGADGFTVAGNLTDTTDPKPVPFLAHANTGGVPTISRILQSDESSLSFAYVPSTGARPGLDKSVIYVVAAKPADVEVTGVRLRAYAWNGVSKDAVFRPLADGDTRKPRWFPGSGLLQYGCGGAILYAVDKSDGSFGLEVVLVK